MDKTMYEFKKEAAKRKVKAVVDGTKRKVDQAVAWGMEHPAEAIAIAGMTIGGIKKLSSVAQTAMEERRRDLEFYDTRRGKYSKIKRRLTPREKQIVDERYSNKESYDKIFYDMGILR